MKSFDASFQERAARAADAKQKALDKMRAKAPVDEAVLAERRATRVAREAAEADERAAKRAAKREADALKAEALAEAKAAKAVAVPTEADRKAARDARYAARKRR